MKAKLFILTLGVLSLMGTCMAFFVTSKWGVNLGDDSLLYLLMARLFENYDVYKHTLLGIILGHNPPLFPFVLSWWHLIGVDLYEGARWFNCLIFGLNIILIGILTKRYTQSAWLGLSAALLLLSAPDILEVHLGAMSEPLFISFMLLWFLLFYEYLRHIKSVILLCSSFILGMALLTISVAVAMATTGLLAIISLNRENKFKVINMVLFMIMPCLAWLWCDSLGNIIENNLMRRHFVFHAINPNVLCEIAVAIFNWFIAPCFLVSANVKIFLLVAGGVLGFFGLSSWWHASKTQEIDLKEMMFTRFSVLLGVFICLYFTCLIFAALFYDAQLPGHFERYIVTVHIVGIVLLCGFIARLQQTSQYFHKLQIGEIIIIYLLIFHSIGATNLLVRQYFFGDHIRNSPCRSSYAIDKLKTVSEGVPIYSNSFQVAYYWSGRVPSLFPTRQSSVTLERNPRYHNQILEVVKDLRNNKGILIYFYGDVMYEEDVEAVRSLKNNLPLRLIAQDNCAAVYDVPWSYGKKSNE